MIPLTARQLEIFWSKIDKSEKCWLWNGTIGRYGYGIFQPNGEYLQAHRVSYELSFDPPGEWCVLHACDVRNCVNPAHLSLGTHVDNVADKVARDRQLKGEEIWLSKLVVADVIEIRSLYATKELTQRQLADVYGVTQSNIHCIVKRKTWDHVQHSSV